MNVLIYSAKPFEISLIKEENKGRYAVSFTEKRLSLVTAKLAMNYDAISIFSADDASSEVLEKLKAMGIHYITLRSTGHDNIDLKKARQLGLKVANVPSYSPNSIAEHAIALCLTFNRKIVKAQHQTLEYNFLLDDLIGFNLHQKKVGVMGTGSIGEVLIKILHGFGCSILANDIHKNEQLIKDYKVQYVTKEVIAETADIIFICLPLNSNTRYLIDKDYLHQLKKKPVLINIARGAIVHTEELLKALDANVISGYATDVYEFEHGVFFYDRSKEIPEDPILHQLLCHSKTLVTPHQGFATNEALQAIISTTFKNLNAWEAGKDSAYELS